MRKVVMAVMLVLAGTGSGLACADFGGETHSECVDRVMRENPVPENASDDELADAGEEAVEQVQSECGE